jgi:hypothetical protein
VPIKKFEAESAVTFVFPMVATGKSLEKGCCSRVVTGASPEDVLGSVLTGCVLVTTACGSAGVVRAVFVVVGCAR